jgi:hypothetical protein
MKYSNGEEYDGNWENEKKNRKWIMKYLNGD